MTDNFQINSFVNGFEPFYSGYLRYVLIAGFFYFLYYVLNKDKWVHRKIQKKFPKNESIWYEIKNSILNLFIFALMGSFIAWARPKGWTQIYNNIDDYGIPYFIFSIVVMILFHDTYFYWAHRFMHLKKVYPIVHLVHHRSTSPTPFSSFSFHPIEGIMQGLGLFIPVFILPLHVGAIGFVLVFMTVFNVLGHLGYEIFPRGTTKSKKWGWHNVVTHHDMHHKHFDCNYSLYFNWWDKIMNTNHEKYHETFNTIASAKPEK